ncbi:trithorax group protein osa [Anopheles ziemanni]|uniref:trithorax group protein osa n=1 Tax=Anopheles coustani TaxID=139045 RepID=UPI002658302F|nr:trithorax group protein osa [Anopheles coustani]XP_058168449.1 trithorax group protein osa [Anopheles ziemanni]
MEGRRMQSSYWTSTWPSTIAILVSLLMATIVPQHVTIALPEGVFPIAKRMNIETCLVRFDVHLNTIIRTEESRSMGACFLDDADLNTREQCLRLCCETENCDVFVFEEKSPGTCFLFQCGPPENFRCKFTHHSNYTSAVLSMPPMEQQLAVPLTPPLAAQIQSLTAQQQSAGGKKHLSQHEMELVSLKDTGTNGGSKQQVAVVASFGTSSTTSLPPLGVRLGETLSTPSASTPKHQPPPPPSSSQCGHFEFPCHSGECIAVYNVCDGIPQCDDGSDEGPECPQKNTGPSGVPGVALNQPMAIIPPNAMDRSGLGGNNQPMEMRGAPKAMLPMYQPLDYQQPPNRFGGIDPEQQQLQQQQQQQQLGKPTLMHRNREDPMTAPKPWPRPAINELNYVDSSDSHFFNHKGGLQLSVANNMGSLASQQYQESMPESNYMPSASVVRGGQSSYLSLPGGSSYSQQLPPQMTHDQQQPQYKPAISPQQWMGGDPVRPNWSMKAASDHIGVGGDGAMVSPREQYMQPPVQQRRPEMQPASNMDPLGASQQKTSQPQTLPSSGQQWPAEGQKQQDVPLPVAPTASASSSFSGEGASGSETLAKDAPNSGPLGQPPVVAGAGESSNGVKHKATAVQGGTHDGDTEYEEDAYEDTYPESTNAASDGGAEAEEPTQTEPPKKKLRKHHKHDHGDSKIFNPSTTNEQAEDKQKKRKKTKTTKKDKAPDHHHGSPSDDTIVHEHLKAVLHNDVEIEFPDHDGYADRPGGAMLSLTLGVLLTAAMGILLSCRMRVARRRIRRPGKSSYAHDADFLVNGMYL